ncbi:unnamed protein product [Rotaria sp. Silwood1]|nr:unnamed protein product [Rotaria sp. Silwood1]CAF0861696.1 unnamed protein product [Rotaria sp. Silwood1]
MVKKDEEMSVSSEAKGPLKSFQALMGEGEKFSRDKLYTKAIQCYTEALDLLPQDEEKSTEKDTSDRLNGLVARSACYLKIGKNDLALQDAEHSLKANKEFTKGLYQKAEALYAMGEFELALMFYHRGKKLRSDLREFQLGINKAQEAIDNSVGDPNRVKLEASGDLSIFYKNDEKKKQPMGYVRASQKKETTVQRKQHTPVSNPKTTKQLLGDLYEDRAFLEKIINNTVVTKANTKSGDAIYQLASDGLDYLDSRTDFWRQQEPLYARSRFIKKLEGDEESYKHIRHELEAIDDQQNKDQFVDARRRAHRLLDFCDRLDERKFAEKQSVLADVYSRLGNAYLELGDYNKSLEYHNRDLKIAETKQFTERSSRALDNLGRVYARSGQFPQAIQVWERKIPLATSSLEKAWLFHEIGQCHFGLGDFERSKRYGERSFTEAVAVNDAVWQLNAKVLVAHSQTKLRQYREAEQTFDEALSLAKDQNDVAAERAIERAMKEVRDQIAKGAADSPPDRTEINYEIKVKSNDHIMYGDEDQSSIRLIIYGDNGSSGPIDLRSDENDTKKYDGQSMTLKKKAFDAGKMTKIALTCNNIESWPLDSIEVSDNKRKTKLRFLLSQPIDSTTTIVDLYQEGSLVQPSSDSSGKDEKKTKAPGTLVSRQSPQTMKRTEQGPSSIRTNDSNKKSTKTDEHKSKTTKSDEQKTPKKDDATDKKSTQKTSSTIESSSDSNKNIEYTISVQTGSVQFAGTDANVFISLYGDKNKIVRYQLKNSVNNKNVFEKDQKDDFVFENIDIGQLKTITIEHDGTGLGPAWYLDFVQVKYNNNTVMFPVERWLDIKQDDQRISLELEPNKKPTSKLTTEVESDKEEKHSSTSSTDEKNNNESSSEKDAYDDFFDNDEDTKEPNAVEYEITVRTADKRSAGTDANVFLSLFGDKNKLERRQLKESFDGARNLFEQGATNRFQIYAADVGKIKTIRIEHDGSGLGNGWYLDSIEVRHISRNETYKFPVDRWLDVGEGDKRISLDLEPDKKPGQLKDDNNTEQEEEHVEEQKVETDE